MKCLSFFVVVLSVAAGLAQLVTHQSCANEPFDCRVGPSGIESFYLTTYRSELAIRSLENTTDTCAELCREWKAHGKWVNRRGYECSTKQFDPQFYIMNSIQTDPVRMDEFNAILGTFDSVDNPYHFGAACRHYLDFGESLGLKASECDSYDFECSEYLSQNPNVTYMIGEDCSKACSHWLHRGRAEGRVASKCHGEPFSCDFFAATVGANAATLKCYELCDQWLAMAVKPQAIPCSADEFSCTEYAELHPTVDQEILETVELAEGGPVRDWVSRSVTWPQAQRMCASKGMRLCNSWEICPNGNGSIPVHGIAYSPIFGAGAPDQWAPHGDSFNAWIHVGIRGDGLPPCTTHENTFLRPAWGTNYGPASFRGWIYCCPSPLPPPRKLYAEVVANSLNVEPSKVHQKWVGDSLTWENAHTECAADGRRMCTRHEICPHVGSGRVEPVLGLGYSPAGEFLDVWTPYARQDDEVDNWLQVGQRPGWVCKEHKEMTGAKMTAVEGQHTHYKGMLYCCDGPQPGGMVRMDLGTAGQSITWDEGDQTCRDNGLQMCSIYQICPNGAAVGANHVPAFGRLGSDAWVPISDTVNDWAQVGVHGFGSCVSHHWMAGLPSWGQQADPKPWRRYLYCCEKNSASPRERNHVTRSHYQVAETTTWSQSHELCHSNGERLCSRHEICSPDAAGVYWPPITVNTDEWTPLDGFNRWMQIGVHGSYARCAIHGFDYFDPLFKTPTWGESTQPVTWRGHVFCCSDSQPHDDMRTFQALSPIEMPPTPQRIEWIHGNPGMTTQSFTRASAEAYCNSLPGMRLCTSGEVCFEGHPWGGVMQFDSWTAVRNGASLLWMQVGIHTGYNTCATDANIAAGEDTGPILYKNHIFCCPISQESPDTGIFSKPPQASTSCAERCENWLEFNEAAVANWKASNGDAPMPPIQRIAKRQVASCVDEPAFSCADVQLTEPWRTCDDACAEFLRQKQFERDQQVANSYLPFHCDYYRAQATLAASLSCFEVWEHMMAMNEPPLPSHPVLAITDFNCVTYALEGGLPTLTCTEAADYWMSLYGDVSSMEYPASTSACAPFGFDCRAYIAQYDDVEAAVGTYCPGACIHFLAHPSRLPIAPPDGTIAIQCPFGPRVTCDGKLMALGDVTDMDQSRFVPIPASSDPSHDVFLKWCAATPQGTIDATNRATYEPCLQQNVAYSKPLPLAPSITAVSSGFSPCSSGYHPSGFATWLCVESAAPSDVANYPYIPTSAGGSALAEIAAVSSTVDGVLALVDEVMSSLQRPFWLRKLGVDPPTQGTPTLPEMRISLGSYITALEEALPLHGNKSYLHLGMQQQTVSYEVAGISLDMASPGQSTMSNADFTFVMSLGDAVPEWALHLHGQGIPILPPLELNGIGFSAEGEFVASSALELWDGITDPFRDPNVDEATRSAYAINGGHLWFKLTAAGKAKRSKQLQLSVDCPVLLRAISISPDQMLLSGRLMAYEVLIPHGTGSLTVEANELLALSFSFAQFSAYGMLEDGNSRCVIGGEMDTNPFSGTPFAALFPVAPSAHVDGTMQPCPWGATGYTNAYVALTDGLEYTFLLDAELGPFTLGWSWRARMRHAEVDISAHGLVGSGDLLDFAQHLETALTAVLDAVRAILQALLELNQLLWSGVNGAIDAAEAVQAAAASTIAGGCEALGSCQVPCPVSKKRNSPLAHMGDPIMPQFVGEESEANDDRSNANERNERSVEFGVSFSSFSIPGIPIPIPGIPDIPGTTIPGLSIPIPALPAVPGISEIYSAVSYVATRTADVMLSSAEFFLGQVCNGGNTVTDLACSTACDAAKTTLEASMLAAKELQKEMNRLNLLKQLLEEAIAKIDLLKHELDFSSGSAFLKAIVGEVRLRTMASGVSSEVGVVIHWRGDDHTYTVKVDAASSMQSVVRDVVWQLLQELLPVLGAIPNIGFDLGSLIAEKVADVVP